MSEATNQPANDAANALAGLLSPTPGSPPTTTGATPNANAGKVGGDVGQNPTATATTTNEPAGDDVQRRVDEAVRKAMAANAGATDAANVTERYVREKMLDLPMSMQNLMPKTTDVKALQKAESDLRKELVDWYHSALAKDGKRLQDVGGGGGGHPVSHLGGPSNVTPQQGLAEALNGGR